MINLIRFLFSEYNIEINYVIVIGKGSWSDVDVFDLVFDVGHARE